MKRLLGATALAAVIATTALAQTATQPLATPDAPALATTNAAKMAWLARGDAGDIHVSDMIGATLYVADDNEDTLDSRTDWDSVGEVNDLLLTRQGEIRAVLVDVGTFLGMGGKTVAAPLEAIRYVSEGPEADEFFLVIKADRATLQDAPAYERPEVRVGDAATRPAVTGAATSTMFSHDGYSRAESHALTAEDLEDATVYDRNDGEIGAIRALILAKDGKISDAVIDVGGFLGMGKRSVAMPFADLTVLRETDGDDVRVYVDATKEKLEAMPRYED